MAVLVPEILSSDSDSDENSLNWTIPWPRAIGNWSDWFTDLLKGLSVNSYITILVNCDNLTIYNPREILRSSFQLNTFLTHS